MKFEISHTTRNGYKRKKISPNDTVPKYDTNASPDRVPQLSLPCFGRGFLRLSSEDPHGKCLRLQEMLQILVGNVFASRKCSHCPGKVAWSEKMFSAVEWGLSPLPCRISPNLRVLSPSANVFTFWTSLSGRNILAARSHRCH